MLYKSDINTKNVFLNPRLISAFVQNMKILKNYKENKWKQIKWELLLLLQPLWQTDAKSNIEISTRNKCDQQTQCCCKALVPFSHRENVYQSATDSWLGGKTTLQTENWMGGGGIIFPCSAAHCLQSVCFSHWQDMWCSGSGWWMQGQP